jgi:hypothetical protein
MKKTERNAPPGWTWFRYEYPQKFRFIKLGHYREKINKSVEFIDCFEIYKEVDIVINDDEGLKLSPTGDNEIWDIRWQFNICWQYINLPKTRIDI